MFFIIPQPQILSIVLHRFREATEALKWQILPFPPLTAKVKLAILLGEILIFVALRG